jgi:hypothetical protein
MRWHYDKVGFPLLELAGAGLDVSLLPGTKWGFEQFLAEGPEGFGNSWYEEVLALNPRLSWRDPGGRDPERLFLTGIRPPEALAFARWLGPDFDLPSVEEWRLVDRWLLARPLDPVAVGPMLSGCSDEARTILSGLSHLERPAQWGGLARLRDGVFEWVRNGVAFAALGRTRRAFLVSLISPQDELLEPTRPLEDRLKFVGFRLIRRHSAAR